MKSNCKVIVGDVGNALEDDLASKLLFLAKWRPKRHVPQGYCGKTHFFFM